MEQDLEKNFYEKWTTCNRCIVCTSWPCPIRKRVEAIVRHVAVCPLATDSEREEAVNDRTNIQLGEFISQPRVLRSGGLAPGRYIFGSSECVVFSTSVTAQERIVGLWKDQPRGKFPEVEVYHSGRWLERNPNRWKSIPTSKFQDFLPSGWKMLSISDALLDSARLLPTTVFQKALFCHAGSSEPVHPYPNEDLSYFKDRCLQGLKMSIPLCLEMEARQNFESSKSIKPGDTFDTGVSLLDFCPLSDRGLFRHLDSYEVLPPWIPNSTPLSFQLFKDPKAAFSFRAPRLLFSISPKLAFIPPQITDFIPFMFYQLKGQNLLLLWELNPDNIGLLSNWWSGDNTAGGGPPGVAWSLNDLKGLQVAFLEEGDCISVPGGCMWSLMTWSDSFYVRVPFINLEPKTTSTIALCGEWIKEIFEESKEEEEDENNDPDSMEFFSRCRFVGQTRRMWVCQLLARFRWESMECNNLGLGHAYNAVLGLGDMDIDHS